MNTTMFSRWLPAVAKTSVARKTVLGVAGLAFVGGAVAGPAAGAMAADTTAKPVAVTQAVHTDKHDDGKHVKPSMDKLIPHGTQGAQSSIALGDDQKANAHAIVDATKKSGLDERAAVIAVATSMQESKLHNLGDLGGANDHDSLGLFQQRPSSGWGSPAQVTDPTYATQAFEKALKQVPDWHELALTDAAQKVQVSAFPMAYAQWEKQAADIVHDAW
jgi:hypothetical protein